MKKTILKSALIAVASVGLFAGGAVADPLVPSHFNLINPDTYADVGDFSTALTDEAGYATAVENFLDAQSDAAAGYYIWSNEDRSEWSVFWTGTQAGLTFEGDLSFYNNSVVTEGTIRYEAPGDQYTFTAATTPATGVDVIDFDAWAGAGGAQWFDGFVFSIAKEDISLDSFITFDLKIGDDGNAPINGDGVANRTYFGSAQSISAGHEGVFVMAAPSPVPEPGTMMLFGAGLAGLAGFSRRRKK